MRVIQLVMHTSPQFLFVCLFWGVSSHSRILHSFGDVTTTGEWLCSALSEFLKWAIHTMTRANPWLWSFPRTRDTHTCCRAFGSGAVTTCFNNQGLPQPGIEHLFKKNNPLRNQHLHESGKRYWKKLFCSESSNSRSVNLNLNLKMPL